MFRVMASGNLFGILGLGLALAAGTAGCNDACTELANDICQCEPTASERQGCARAVEADGKADPPSDDQEAACQEILDSGSCTCEALGADDYAACGLAK